MTTKASATGTSGRAVVVKELGGPEVMHVQADAKTRAPTEGEVLIAIEAAGVNPVGQ